MSHASQMIELSREVRDRFTEFRLRKSLFLFLASILLHMVCPTYGFSTHHMEESGVAARRSQEKSEIAPVKRLVTVLDSIRMTRLGDRPYDWGAPSKGLVAKFSPDGKRFVVVLRKGNLETNTNDYSLILFETHEVFRSPNPRVLLSMSSTSNRPAIQNIVWTKDNDTILFLGENPGETTQLYSLRSSSKELKKLTNHATNLVSFAAAAMGGEIIFIAENPEVSLVNESSAREGINVTSEVLTDLLAGKQGGAEDGDHTLFIEQAGSEAETRIMTAGRVGAYSEMWLSQDGLHLIITTEATQIPEKWNEYDDRYLRLDRHPTSAPGAETQVFQYELVDLSTHTGRLLLDAPIGALGSEASWSPDGQSVVVSNAYLTLNTDDLAERAQRKAHTFLAEVKISNLRVLKISDEDLRLLAWDAKTNEVVCDVGRIDSLNGQPTPKAYFTKSNDSDRTTWFRSSVPQARIDGPPSRPDIVLEENMNQHPRIFAIAPGGGQKSLLMDLNPQFRDLAFARVEELDWRRTSRRQEVKAGLYWPLDYVAGKRYPLIIQTHGWSSDRFWVDGPWTTAFAAQALAGKGFFVLQLPDPDDPHLAETPEEAPAAIALYDGAIDLLDGKRLIDVDHIGIIGFSRTYWYVTYALIHSKYHFAAAAVADGVDYSYFQYMVLSTNNPVYAGSFDLTNGAPPFGNGLRKWLKVSPAFLMDKIDTPTRVQALYPASLLFDWHWFSGLTRLGKPVEMIYIPEGAHILQKPWDRMISQQGDVDWFCFWLKGEEDPDPAKAEQYKRWHNLRVLNDKQRKRQNTMIHTIN